MNGHLQWMQEAQSVLRRRHWSQMRERNQPRLSHRKSVHTEGGGWACCSTNSGHERKAREKTSV